MSSVTTFLPITDGQVACPLWVWNASSSDQLLNFVDACLREALAVTSSAPSSFKIWVHDLIAEPHQSSHTVGILRPSLSVGACNPTRGNVLGRFQIFLDVPSKMDSTSPIAVGERITRQWVWLILECAP